MFELKKIGIVKRASAGLLDLILLAVLATGFMWIISLISGFDHKQDLAAQYYNDYYVQWENFRKENLEDIATNYGFTYEVNEEDDTYTLTKDNKTYSLDEVMDIFVHDVAKSEEMLAIYKKYEELTPYVIKMENQAQLVYNLTFMMISLGILLAYLVLEFILPIILKNGQTVGKKVFSICLVRPNCVKIAPIALFARTFLGKFAVETMFPVLLVFLFLFGGLGWISIILLAALVILNAVLFFVTKNRTPIHDIFASTVAVDMKLQMIYASEEELNEKKSVQHKEYVENSKEEL